MTILKIINVILILFLINSCCTQGYEETIQYDNGQMLVGNLKNGKKTGLWNLYYQNGIIHGMDSYYNDKLNGKWVFWDSIGNLLEEGYYVDGLKHGMWKLYNSSHSSGTLLEEVNYNKGFINGTNTIYHRINNRFQIKEMTNKDEIGETWKVFEFRIDSIYKEYDLSGGGWIEYDHFKEKLEIISYP